MCHLIRFSRQGDVAPEICTTLVYEDVKWDHKANVNRKFKLRARGIYIYISTCCRYIRLEKLKKTALSAVRKLRSLAEI